MNRDEFVLVNNVVKENNKMKEEIKNLSSSSKVLVYL